MMMMMRIRMISGYVSEAPEGRQRDLLQAEVQNASVLTDSEMCFFAKRIFCFSLLHCEVDSNFFGNNRFCDSLFSEKLRLQ